MGAPTDETTSDAAVRVLLVDARDDRRNVMRYMVDADKTYARVVGEANSGATALELLDGLEADAVIIELQMPPDEGMKAIATLRDGSSDMRIIVCSFALDADTSKRAIDAGADTCLPKPIRRSDLRDALGNLGFGSSDGGDVTPPALPSPPKLAPARG